MYFTHTTQFGIEGTISRQEFIQFAFRGVMRIKINLRLNVEINSKYCGMLTRC